MPNRAFVEIYEKELAKYNLLFAPDYEFPLPEEAQKLACQCMAQTAQRTWEGAMSAVEAAVPDESDPELVELRNRLLAAFLILRNGTVA